MPKTSTTLVDQLQVEDVPVLISHATDDRHRDEGFVQTAEVSVTSTMQPNQQLYKSIWAENKVINKCLSVYKGDLLMNVIHTNQWENVPNGTTGIIRKLNSMSVLVVVE